MNACRKKKKRILHEKFVCFQQEICVYMNNHLHSSLPVSHVHMFWYWVWCWQFCVVVVVYTFQLVLNVPTKWTYQNTLRQGYGTFVGPSHMRAIFFSFVSHRSVCQTIWRLSERRISSFNQWWRKTAKRFGNPAKLKIATFIKSKCLRLSPFFARLKREPISRCVVLLCWIWTSNWVKCKTQ